MRKHILLGAVSVVGLSLAAAVPIAGQAPSAESPTPIAERGGPAVAAPGPEQAAAAIGRGRRGGGPGRFGGRPGDDHGMGLTDDQRASIEKLRLKSRDDVAPLVDKIRLARRELHRAVFAEKADAAATKKLSAEVATLGQQIVEKRLETRKAFAALLTDDQRAKLRTGIGMAGARPAGRRSGTRDGFGPARDDGAGAPGLR